MTVAGRATSGLMGRYAASRVVTWLVEEGGSDLDHCALITVLEKPRMVCA